MKLGIVLMLGLGLVVLADLAAAHPVKRSGNTPPESSGHNQEDVRRAFDFEDKNGDEQLTLEEFTTLLARSNTLTTKQVTTFFGWLDEDRNGKLSFDEYWVLSEY